MTPELVTVFGGSGFLGRTMVRALARAGYRIRVAVRRPNLAHDLRPIGDAGQIQILRADVTDPVAVAAAVEGATHVVNLVGILHESGRQRFSTVQAQAPGLVAEAAAKAGALRLVQMSAIGADAQSDSTYARTKAEGERAARAAFPAATILRPSVVFGPGDRFFTFFAMLGRVSPVLPLFGGGATRFQPVFVGDVAAALVAALAQPGTAGRTFELGGPNVMTLREIFELMLAVTRRKRILLPVPFWAASLQATVLGLLPNPLLTRDQVKLLKRDNVVGLTGEAGIGTFADLGITDLKTAEAVVPTYLARFRKHGEFNEG